jgi:hypothetical protein
MSSKWGESFRHTLALRLGIWYAAIFVISATALTLFAYLLLARALEVRDHQVIDALLTRYARAVCARRAARAPAAHRRGCRRRRHEQMLVRVLNGGTELVYYAEPGDSSAWDASQLDQPETRRPAGPEFRAPPTQCSKSERDARYDIAIQVGRTSHVRAELLEYFRQRAFEIGGVLR